MYKRRQQEYDRCREALRMAEQGAEIGATGENKVNRKSGNKLLCSKSVLLSLNSNVNIVHDYIIIITLGG